MKSIGYGRFCRQLLQRTGGKRSPLRATVEVASDCPLNCVHCYNRAPMRERAARSPVLDFREHCRLLDELGRAGVLWLLYTGGEPFAREDFLDIYGVAREKGMIVSLFTNAVCLDEKTVERLTRARPFLVEVTLYGKTRETYERITRVPGSHARCLRGIRLLAESGLNLRLKTMALTLNRHELPEMKRYAEEELGLPFRFDAMLNCRIDCSAEPLAYRLEPDQVVALDRGDPERMACWRELADRQLRGDRPGASPDQLYRCGGGVHSFAVDPWGGMSLCALSRRRVYDWRSGSFGQGWQFLSEVRGQPATRPGRCTACQIRAICGICPAVAELETGDPEAHIEFMCRVGHARMKAFGLPVAPHGDCEYCQSGASEHARSGK